MLGVRNRAVAEKLAGDNALRFAGDFVMQVVPHRPCRDNLGIGRIVDGTDWMGNGSQHDQRH